MTRSKCRSKGIVIDSAPALADLKALWVCDIGLPLASHGHFLSYSLVLGAIGGTLGAKLIATIGRRGFTT